MEKIEYNRDGYTEAKVILSKNIQNLQGREEKIVRSERLKDRLIRNTV